MKYAGELLEVEAALTPAEMGLVRMTLARAASSAGDVQEALTHWAAVPPEAPEYREARLAGARALVEAGRAPEALRWVSPLLTGEDPGAEAHLAALAAAEGAGDLTMAAKLCAELADHPPPGRSAADFLFRRSIHLRGLGDSSEYAAALEAFVTRFPEDPRVSEAAAELQRNSFDAGDWEGTVRWSRLAQKVSERYPAESARYLEAEALFRLNRKDEAQDAFQKLAANDGPLKPSALARLGAIYDEAGKSEQAAGAYEQALEAGLSGEAAAWIRNRLAVLKGADGGEAR